jgi:hypothetical protein
MVERPEEEFTPEEQRALDAWKVDEAPDFSERVIARLDAKPRRPFWIGVAVVAAAVGLVIAAASIRARPESASYLAKTRMAAPISGRAVAVMEQGAALFYRRTSGLIEVEQSAGDVFYRVDPGDAFVVRTSAGTVTVVGTCFRVEVIEMNSKTAGALGTAAGALVASTVFVTVYEGKVVTASAQGAELPVEAGERAELAPGRAPVKREVGREQAVAAETLWPAPADRPITPELLVQRVRVLEQEKGSLEQEVARLREQLEKGSGAKGETKMYDIPQAELVKMAENCELRWDMPGIGAKPQQISTEDLEKLELSEAEREVIDRAFAESHGRLFDVVRKTYSKVTGDEETGSMAAEAMFAEIRDKTPVEELKRIYQVLARERAGLQPPPPAGAKISPVEQLYRMVTSEGERVEQSIAAELGQETARRIRDHHRGWGDRFRSSRGCP